MQYGMCIFGAGVFSIDSELERKIWLLFISTTLGQNTYTPRSRDCKPAAY